MLNISGTFFCIITVQIIHLLHNIHSYAHIHIHPLCYMLSHLYKKIQDEKQVIVIYCAISELHLTDDSRVDSADISDSLQLYLG